VPAAIVCAIRGRWLYFWCGWVTLGIVWFIGALAREPENPSRDRRAVAAVAAGFIAAVLVLGLFGARPSPLLGLDGSVLQSSVGNGYFYGTADSCAPLRRGRVPDGGWLCGRYDAGFSGTVNYEVHSNGLGCWHAVRVGPPGEGSPERLSGCVNLYDFVFS
jgi:hypothetical protein